MHSESAGTNKLGNIEKHSKRVALIILGQSKCGLCQQVLLCGEDIVGLPASPYTNHPLYTYFDQGFHKNCFDNWDKKETVEGLIKKAKDEFKHTEYYKEMEKKYGPPKWLEDERLEI